MLARKAVHKDKKVIIRDKEAKISAIIDATRHLIETMGYDKVTIQDIAEMADVSVGTIYRYFPDGKFDIMKGFGVQSLGDLLTPQHPDDIDYADFPGYMRELIVKYRRIARENRALVKALIAASLSEGELLEGVRNVDVNDMTAIAELFGRFDGVDITGKDPAELLLEWGTMVKGILLFNTMYPLQYKNDESLTDLMVDLSIRIWGYDGS